MFEWLLELGAWKRLEAVLKGNISFTDEQIKECTPKAQTSDSDPSILSRASDKGEILVEGILTERFDFMAWFIGGANTTYQDIRASLALLDQDKTVKEATMVISSPGGKMAGLFDTMEAIRQFSKPIKAIVRGEAASAAYALASVTDSIEATNKSDSVGSIGIVVDVKVEENKIKIASAKAPKKAPDVTTDEGKKIVQEQLDDIHTIFVEAIAGGRGTTEKDVNENFGQGAMVLAEKALKVGMIDKIQTKAVEPKTKTKPRSDSGRKEAKMDLKELMANHRGLYEEVFGLGVIQGRDTERDRVGAHLVMGAHSGAMDTAIKAVKEGAEMTETLRATYLTSGKNNADISNAAADAAALAAAADGANSGTDEDKDKATAKAIMEAAAEKCNVEIKL